MRTPAQDPPLPPAPPRRKLSGAGALTAHGDGWTDLVTGFKTEGPDVILSPDVEEGGRFADVTRASAPFRNPRAHA